MVMTLERPQPAARPLVVANPPRTLKQIAAADDGAPFTVPELCELTTLAHSTILKEIRLGYLKTTQREGSRVHLIAFDEGRRWLLAIGAIRG